jgi:hypothetical protein
MYKKVRDVHLHTALLCLPFLLMFAVSGLQMAHRRWFPAHTQLTFTTVQLPSGLPGAREAARLLALPGELSAIAISGGITSFRIARPGTTYQVEYNSSTGMAMVQATNSGFTGTLNRLHQLQGTWHNFTLLNIWSGVLGFVSFGILLVGLTGLYMGFRNRKDRWTGLVLLFAGSGLALILIAWMRS